MASVHLSSSLLLAVGLLALPGPARAQTHVLPYAQAGAALEYARAEARILYAAVTAKQFDLGFTRAILEQLETALAEAKRNVDKAETLLPEKMAKRSDALLALREKIVAAETQRAALLAAVTEETKVLTVEDEEEAEDLPPTDWRRLERETKWLAADVRAAASAHGKLVRPLGVRTPKRVPEARGKRE